MTFRLRLLALFLSALPLLAFGESTPDPALAANFKTPPDSARPWVYWFWNNGNLNKEGITADLEAMKRVGIGGVLIMDVVERFAPPKGTATFMGPEWQDLFHFAVTEANRLGLEINMTNGPGWCGSSGPWITPELSMRQLVCTDKTVTGHFDGILDQPVGHRTKKDILASNLEITDDYRDIAVLAIPQNSATPIESKAVVDLTSKMGPDGHLVWDAPPGTWTIERIGHVTTGSSTRPPVLGGNGLECDKMSAEAMDAQFAGMMQKLIDQSGPLAGKVLVATHIDSWEVGSQNWTKTFREEFQKRRGYDPLPYLPCLTGKTEELVNGKKVAKPHWQIGGQEVADRFRWDFAQTGSELLAQNYSGRLAELAHQKGLRLTIEGYDLPFGDEATYTAAADEPMTEFWTPSKPGGGSMKLDKAREMASIAHTNGRPIVGAESFTSGDQEKWQQYPASIKSLGDQLLSLGVNRFVFHRYAFQPWLDKVPGSTMGPWGLHYERTNTWWDMSGPWHEYLARCNYMLRQGNFIADLLYLRPELPNQTGFRPTPALPAGYNYDECSAQCLISRASTKDGRIVFPDGTSYRVLVLSPDRQMTPALARKLRDLVKNGAVVLGDSPQSSPSLSGYPKCDDELKGICSELWEQGKPSPPGLFESGKVVPGTDLTALLATLKTSPDFTSDTPLNWIHRHTAEGADLYFVANPQDKEMTVNCTFRVAGLQPELWNPESGSTQLLPIVSTNADSTTVSINFDPVGSFFVVFEKPVDKSIAVKNPFPSFSPVTEIKGPWEVQFPPKWGAPEKITLPELTSWSDHSDPGVKYFSGTATYSKSFTFDKKAAGVGTRYFLDLGDVQVMARVKLNNRDLGILWKTPFRMDVSEAIQDGENSLEIQVVNLWPNRLIGDAALPPEKRVTWCTWEPYRATEPLLKSGLLGPVHVETAAP